MPIALVTLMVALLVAAVLLPQMPIITPENPVKSKASITQSESHIGYCQVEVSYPADGAVYNKQAFQLGVCTHDVGTPVKITYNQKQPEKATVQLPVSPIEIIVLVMAFALVALLTLRVIITERKTRREDS